jgi:hypothetical protein
VNGTVLAASSDVMCALYTLRAAKSHQCRPKKMTRAGEAVLSSGKDESTPDSGSFATPYLRTFSWNIFSRAAETNYRAWSGLSCLGVMIEP